jgi:ribonuclease HIII
MLKSQLTITNYYELVTNQQPIAGIDEVGRGALCGPVVAAVMILKPESYGELIGDECSAAMLSDLSTSDSADS